MTARSSSRGSSGFTLIELLVTIAIASILMLIGVPSFVAFQRNSELTSATNSLVAAMNAARGEAMKRGMTAMVVPASGTDWSSGWTVFVDKVQDQAYDESEDITVLKQGALQGYFSAAGQTGAGTAADYVMFDPSGYSKTAGSAAFRSLTLSVARNDLSGTAKTEQTRLLVIAVTGRIRACRPATDTTCVVTATE
jgi:type IV fimbrial biogenesis protein FimT